MNNIKHIVKTSIALIFLSAYLNVFFTEIQCGFAHLIDQSGIPHEHENGHDHHHGEHEVPAHPHSDSGSDHDHDRTSTENCCNETTSSFFSAQNQNTSGLLDVKNLISELTHFSNASPSEFFVSEINSIPFIFNEKPPPKVPNIRIFIQSFQV